MDITTINDSNCKQFVFDYGEKNYMAELIDAMKLFPYDNSGLSVELAFKNSVEWFLYEWVNPKTGKTIVMEFVEKFNVQEPLKSKMLQMEKPWHSKFRVLEKNLGGMTVEDTKTGKKHEIILVQFPENYRVGTEFEGRMHQWGEAYRLAGIVDVQRSEEEIDTELFTRYGLVSPKMVMEHFKDSKMKEIENIVFGSKTTVSSILNKYPAHWVDGICDSLKIQRNGLLKRDKIAKIQANLLENTETILKSLSDEELKCLKLVADSGGVVKYRMLSGFDDEIDYWWNEHDVKSTIGKLRAKGLLYVGKIMLNGMLFRAATMPEELIPKLRPNT